MINFIIYLKRNLDTHKDRTFDSRRGDGNAVIMQYLERIWLSVIWCIMTTAEIKEKIKLINYLINFIICFKRNLDTHKHRTFDSRRGGVNAVIMQYLKHI